MSTLVDLFDLSGRVAVVTGAGRGLGREIAVALAGAGGDIVLAGRSEADLSRVAVEIEGLGRRAVAVRADVTDASDVRDLGRQTLERFGRVDILVNNAGMIIRKPFLETDETDWRVTLDTNLIGVYRCCHAFGRHMVEARSGVVINVGSIAGIQGRARTACYGAAKAAVVQFSRGLAVEWGPSNVRVNVIVPGQFDTDMGRPVIENPKALAEILKRTPLGRVGDPMEIGPLAVYLASDASRFVTGAAFVVDGGATAG